MKLLRCGTVALAVVAAAMVWAQVDLRPALPKPEFKDEDDVEIELKADKVGLDELVDKLQQATGLLVLVSDDLREMHKDDTFTISEKDRLSLVLMKLSMQLSAWPQTAVIFCTDEEKPKREPVLEIPDKKVTAKLSDMDTETVLALVGAAGGVEMYATEAVLKEHGQLSVDFEEVPTEKAISELAEKLEAEAVRGIYLKKFDREAAFKQFMALSPQQQEKLLVEASRKMQSLNMTDEQLDRAIDQSLQNLFNMPRERRKQIISRVAERFHQLAGVMRRFSPEGLRQIQQAWKPLIQRGISRFMRLPANRQAELAPIVRALRELPFSW